MLEIAQGLELLNGQRKISAQLATLQSSVNQLLTGEKSIMSQLAALQAVDQAIDQAISALGAEEAADATAIQNAITLIQNQLAAGGITDAQATPVIADLQAQLVNLQNATAALGTARGTLSTAISAASAPAAIPAPSTTPAAS